MIRLYSRRKIAPKKYGAGFIEVPTIRNLGNKRLKIAIHCRKRPNVPGDLGNLL